MYTFIARIRPFDGFPGDSNSKESACNAGDLDSIPGLGRSLGGGHGNLLCSCLVNPLGRGAWQSPWGLKKLGTTEGLSTAQHVAYIRV